MNEFRVVPFMKGEEVYVRVYIGNNYVDLNYKQVEKLNEELEEILGCEPKGSE